MPDIIFCPKCHTLLLEAPQCPKCGWKRPTRPPGQDKRLLWEMRFGEGIVSGLTWAQGKLFFVDGSGRLHGLDVETGEETWEQPVELGLWRIFERVAAGNKELVLGAYDDSPLTEADKAVRAYDFVTGKMLWQRPLQQRQISDPLIFGGRVFVSVSSGEAVALNLEDGAFLWRAPIGGIYMAAPAAWKELVYFGSDQGALIALRQDDGAVAWTFQVEAFGSWPESIPYTPTVADGALYFTCWNRKTYALDALTGQVIWISEPTKKRPPMTPPLVGDDTVYFAAHDRYVYALDRATGRERWRTQLPRRSEVQPLLVGDLLYVAALDHHIYALDAATGEVQDAPILTTGGKASKAWAFDGQNLYVADDLGKLYAVQLVQPIEAMQTPTALMQSGQWEEAAVAWALQGEYVRAAEIYATQLKQPGYAAQLYEKGEETLLAATQYEAAGQPKKALELYRQARAWDKVAVLSEHAGDLLTAAQAYEHLERWAKAGKCYYDLGKYAQAVALYEHAAHQAQARGDESTALLYLDWAVQMYRDKLEQPAKAVVLLDEFGQKEAAAELLQTIPGWKDEPALIKLYRKVVNSPRERARAYELAGAPLLAAREYVEAGEHKKAADLLARVGEYKLAAEQYLLAHLPDKAADMMVRMENWDEAADLYLRAERLQDALQAFLQAGDIRRAAELYEQLGQWSDAAARWEGLALWEKAARAWEKAQDYARAARAWVQEGDSMKAAENYEEAARQHSLNAPRDYEPMARYYELAMVQYQASGVRHKADLCDARRRQFRQQPLLHVNALYAGETLQLDEWGKLDVIIVNNGWGQARDIRIQVSTGRFELDTSRLEQAVGLAPGVQTRYALWLKPREAGLVPLHLTLTYLDKKGQPMPELTYDAEIRVRRPGSQASTPQIVHQHIQGDFIQADRVEKQTGDRVDVSRGGGSGVSVQEDASHIQSSAPTTAPTIECPQCGLEQPATHSRCQNPRCGEPFIQCPSCGLYQPFDKTNQFCIHCGASL